jgi:hypothetical protein|tara:strand:- start:200 stop:670 length:471 start_codon:yes stop_codon:yes gene_type:complete
MSGRVNITQKGGTPLFLQTSVEVDDKSNYYSATKHLFQPSKLSNIYFSAENINRVHQLIKERVYDMSNKKYLIDNQNRDELKIIMKSIFLQYSTFSQTNDEIERLNEMAIVEASRIIYTELMSYLKYKEDASSLVIPMSRPAYIHKDNTIKYQLPF